MEESSAAIHEDDDTSKRGTNVSRQQKRVTFKDVEEVKDVTAELEPIVRTMLFLLPKKEQKVAFAACMRALSTATNPKTCLLHLFKVFEVEENPVLIKAVDDFVELKDKHDVFAAALAKILDDSEALIASLEDQGMETSCLGSLGYSQFSGVSNEPDGQSNASSGVSELTQESGNDTNANQTAVIPAVNDRDNTSSAEDDSVTTLLQGMDIPHHEQPGSGEAAADLGVDTSVPPQAE
ncbi:expressed unknown protein [Seminavis robusta]|uniref:Uncharacterized protein n=1 Tax=Seminavis robusta TaxID=568900 RepID=A0A9N8DQQ3_9STRA|nr:expressed unknown protein [Seminavis robusta]|eukprot:Sro287_g108580.1 n/a (237) ;mRNA; r:32955-33965